MWFIARLLLIAQPYSYRIAAYLKAALTLGLEVVIASRGQYSLVSEVNQGLHINLDDIDISVKTILDYAQQHVLVGVLGCDDSTVELAAKVAEQLHLPHNPSAAARLSSRKDLARQCLADADCTVPKFSLLNLADSCLKQVSGINFPVVIKPLNLSASRGVIRANNSAELRLACTRIKNIIKTNDAPFLNTHLLLEEYIAGVEVAYEGFLLAGVLTTLALFDKPDPLHGPYFEETIYVTPSNLDKATQQTIKASVAGACRAYGLVTGPIHAELRVNNQGAWILEVASRTIGGQCARVLDSGLGYNLEFLTLALAIGQSVNFQVPDSARGVMMIPIKKLGILRRVVGLAKARAITHIDRVDIVIRAGNQLIPLPEGSQYLGYIFASAEQPEAVILALRRAHAALEIIVAPVFKLTTET